MQITSRRFFTMMVKNAGYYSHRLVVIPLLRRIIISVLGIWVGRPRRAAPSQGEWLEKLKTNGIASLGSVLTKSQCMEIVDYLADKEIYETNSSLGTVRYEAKPDTMAFGVHLRNDVLDCPHIIELVSSPTIVKFAGDYLGCRPTLSCLGIQWSFPVNTPNVAQKFHRDSEDWKYLRFIVYLTYVSDGCGPHVYVKGSHTGRLPLRLRFYSLDEILKTFGTDSVTTVYGRRGTGIAADTSGIHKGEAPSSHPRLILTFTFSILANPFEEYTPLRTRHRNDLCNYTNRLFLRR